MFEVIEITAFLIWSHNAYVWCNEEDDYLSLK